MVISDAGSQRRSKSMTFQRDADRS